MQEQQFDSQVKESKPLFKFSDTMGTFLFLVLNSISAGIVGCARMYLIAREVNEMSGITKISRKTMIVYFSVLGLNITAKTSVMTFGFAASQAGYYYDDELIMSKLAPIMDTISGFASIFGLVGAVVLIIWTFTVREALLTHTKANNINLRMAWFWTLIFNLFYINYKMNEYNEIVERREAELNNPVIPNTDPEESKFIA